MRSIGIGAWGEDVTTLQETLNNLGYLVKIDGIFGNETRIAVIRFQEANTDESGAPLIVDGIVGPKAWWALAHASAFPNASPTTAPTMKTAISKFALAGIGEDVTTLQETLNNLGYPVKIDGIFGTETRVAVLKFQERNTDENGVPLVVDGIVGPKTWWALTHASTLLASKRVNSLPNAVATTPQIPTTSKLALVGIVAALIGGYLLLVGNK